MYIVINLFLLDTLDTHIRIRNMGLPHHIIQ